MPKVKPFDQIEWDRRTAEITDDAGKVIFKQENVEVPKSWSLLATKVVVSKYFYGEQHTSERETSVRQLIHRICRTIADWGVADGYFSKADGEVFYEELTWLCLNQYGAFNSPVWFNVGLFHQYGIGKNSGKGNWFYNRKTGQAERATTQYEYPQGSACFIQSVRTTWRHHAPRPQRGDAVQIRLRHRHRPFAHPFQQGKAQRRRPAQRPDEFS
jgi:ribonucleoside-diphosphate reductase alpha chain